MPSRKRVRERPHRCLECGKKFRLPQFSTLTPSSALPPIDKNGQFIMLCGISRCSSGKKRKEDWTVRQVEAALLGEKKQEFRVDFSEFTNRVTTMVNTPYGKK